jgi:hypothetical protein
LVKLCLDRRILTERSLVLLGVALGLLAIVGLEGCARMLPRPASSDLARLHRYSEVYGWEPRPGARAGGGDRVVTINGRGYRGREVAPRPDSDLTRVVLVGDSIAFGIGVADDETFASRLDGQGLEVVNLAVEGRPEQSLLRLEREGTAPPPTGGDEPVPRQRLRRRGPSASSRRRIPSPVPPGVRRLVGEDAHLRLTRPGGSAALAQSFAS